MHINPENLRTAANDLRAIAADLIEDVRSLTLEAETVMTDHWKGNAGTTHLVAWTDWSASARRLVCALGQEAHLLDHVSHTFVAADNAFAQAVA